ncbi:MAG: NifB/NifX family molybdenum-iron cluster-binding protein [Desulfobacteraceae bacterium]|nr:NifB/NifX family molybdenum-iron cluster-binding protein [Desulfobacteraceae bacterium]
MKVLIASQGLDMSSPIDLRFARVNYFLLVDTDSNEITAVVNNQHINSVQEAWVQAAQTVVGLAAEAVIVGNVGPKTLGTLWAAGVCVYSGAKGTVTEALEQFKAGELEGLAHINTTGYGA